MRNSNIELIRIIAILFILFEHAIIFLYNPVDFSIAQPYWIIPKEIASILCSFFIIGVNVFILISGFFTIKLNLRKVLYLWYTCAFYELFCLIVKVLIGEAVSFKDCLKVILSLDNGWFMPTYLALMLLSPILNLFIIKSSKKDLLFTLFCLLLCNCYLGYMRNKLNNPDGFSLLNFVNLYFIGAYIRQYLLSDAIPFLRIFSIYILSTCVIFIMSLHKGGIFAFSYNSPFVLLASISFFCFFAKKMDFKSEIVNKGAQYAFPIFLTNSTFIGIIRSYQLNDYGHLIILPLLFLLYFIVIGIVDQIRKIIGPLIIESIGDFLQRYYKKILE